MSRYKSYSTLNKEYKKKYQPQSSEMIELCSLQIVNVACIKNHKSNYQKIYLNPMKCYAVKDKLERMVKSVKIEQWYLDYTRFKINSRSVINESHKFSSLSIPQLFSQLKIVKYNNPKSGPCNHKYNYNKHKNNIKLINSLRTLHRPGALNYENAQRLRLNALFAPQTPDRMSQAAEFRMLQRNAQQGSAARGVVERRHGRASGAGLTPSHIRFGDGSPEPSRE